MRVRNVLGIALLLGLGLLVPAGAGAADEKTEPLTPRSLSTKLAAKLSSDEAEALAQRVRGWFGKDKLAAGAAPEGRRPGGGLGDRGARSGGRRGRLGRRPFPPSADAAGEDQRLRGHRPSARGDGHALGVPGRRQAPSPRRRRLTRSSSGTPMRSRSIPSIPTASSGRTYPRGSSPRRSPGRARSSTARPATGGSTSPRSTRTTSPPASWSSRTAAATPRTYVPTVFDNLIAKKEMPVTIGIFINPGTRRRRERPRPTAASSTTRSPTSTPGSCSRRSCPRWKRRSSSATTPTSRAIGGISSGGICSWTVAWERPDEFRKVLSLGRQLHEHRQRQVRPRRGPQLRGLIRKTAKKPIRVFLQDGANDLDNKNGNWPLANQQMAKALAFAGYDYKFVYGQGFHSGKHGRRHPARLAPLALARLQAVNGSGKAVRLTKQSCRMGAAYERHTEQCPSYFRTEAARERRWRRRNPILSHPQPSQLNRKSLRRAWVRKVPSFEEMQSRRHRPKQGEPPARISSSAVPTSLQTGAWPVPSS